MATRASSPSRSRSGASSRGSTSRGTGSKKSTPARPRQNTGGGGLGAVVRAIGRALAAIWNGLARLIGGAVRGLGAGVHDLDPAVKRDGAGLALIGVGIVIAAAFWFMIPGAFGDWLRMVVSTVFGALSVMLPLAMFGMAWRTMRDPAANGPAGRQVVGWMTLLLGVLGLINISKKLPTPSEPEQMRAAGGVLGFISSSLLADLLTVWVTVPLLLLLSLFGVLVITGVPIADLPRRFAYARQILAARPKPPQLTFGVDRAYDTPLILEPVADDDEPVDVVFYDQESD